VSPWLQRRLAFPKCTVAAPEVRQRPAHDSGGNKVAENFATCRGCHPLASKDFVWRYDEHFATRK
jgi:hypothetical protein